MIAIEAWHANRYWKKYFERLNMKQQTRRGDGGEIKTILDAVSKLMSGITLRYILYHRLSPYHGFLHVPTDYPALVYDLMEPYRGYVENVVFDVIQQSSESAQETQSLMGACIKAVETYFDQNVYVNATRQIVTFQELLHGAVLGFISYLNGTSRQFIVPMPGKPNGGRPLNAGYRLYGRSAGKTDFWAQAKAVAAETVGRVNGSYPRS